MLKKLVEWWLQVYERKHHASEETTDVLALLHSIDDQQHEFATELKEVKQRTDTLYSLIEDMQNVPPGWSASRKAQR